MKNVFAESRYVNLNPELIDLLHLKFGVFVQLGTHRSKGLFQNFCQTTEHCLIPFDDIPSCERVRGGIS